MFARAKPQAPQADSKAARAGSPAAASQQPQPGRYWSAFVFGSVARTGAADAAAGAGAGAPVVRRKCKACAADEERARAMSGGGAPVLRRKCAACDEAEKGAVVRRQALSPASTPAGPVEVGRADDPLEHEADRVAHEVLADRGAGPAEATSPRRIQTSRDPSAASGPSRAAAWTGSSGRPLPAADRAFFEPRFGRSFEDVRLHTGPAAAAAAASVHARAFTLGRDIVLGEGAAPAATHEGRLLLAHELAHVVQQDGRPGEARLVRRFTRDLPTTSGASSFLLYPSVPSPTVRVDALAHAEGGLRTDSALRPRVSAIVGPGATIRGIARGLLPLFQRATPPTGTNLPPQATTPPTEDELAKAILEYSRHYLPVPGMTDFRVGMRLTLPIEIDLDVGSTSRRRGDWIVDFASIQLGAAAVSAAEAALVDTPPQAGATTAPTATSPEVTQFLAAQTDALGRGVGLSTQLARNPVEGGPFATAVLAALPAADRFDAALELVSHLVNHQISAILSVRPGYDALRAVRAILASPPSPQSGSREEARQRGLRGLPEDPTSAVGPELLVDDVYQPDADDPMTIYFERGRASVPETESTKLRDIARAQPTGGLTLSGSHSDDEPRSLALARAQLIESVLQPMRPNGTQSAREDLTGQGTVAGLGVVDYPFVRRVKVTVGAPPAPPACGPGVATADPCAATAPAEMKFVQAQPRAVQIVADGVAALNGSGADALIPRYFGPGVSRAAVRRKVQALQTTVANLASQHLCGNDCNGTCSVAFAYAPGSPPPLMVLCDRFSTFDTEMAASVLVHEACHATRTIGAVRGRGPADWSYRWERMFSVMTEVTPNRALDNADSITLFLMELRQPVTVGGVTTPVPAFTPDRPPQDQFVGTWTPAQRTRVAHALAFTQKWLVWGGQYIAHSHAQIVSGNPPNATYGFIATRFGLTPASGTPTARDRMVMAGILARVEALKDRLRYDPITITHAASGQPTRFSTSAPFSLEVGADVLGIAGQNARARALMTKLFAADPDIPAAQSTLYSDVMFDIQAQYIRDRS